MNNFYPILIKLAINQQESYISNVSFHDTPQFIDSYHMQLDFLLKFCFQYFQQPFLPPEYLILILLFPNSLLSLKLNDESFLL